MSRKRWLAAFLLTPQIVPQVVGGLAVAPNDPLALTTVGLESNPSQGDTFCSGTLIDRDLVLTAAHCFPALVSPKPRVVTGLVGKLKILFDVDAANPQGQESYVDALMIHPTYDPRYNQTGAPLPPHGYHDLALLYFRGGIPPVALRAGYHAAPILSPEAYARLAPGTSLIVAGYGADEERSRTGSGRLRLARVPLHDPRYTPSDLTTDQRGGQGACYGDSGGPAYLPNPAFFARGAGPAYSLVGATHGGHDCTSFTTYAAVPLDLAWLSSAAAALRQAVRRPPDPILRRP